MSERGVIVHRERAQQILDFSGLKFGDTWTPTDCDLYVEIRDRIYIFGEYKFSDTPLKYGQETALTRLTDLIADTGRHSMFFIARHDVPVCDDVDAAAAIVERLRYQKTWYPGKNATAYEIISRFLARFYTTPLQDVTHGTNGRGNDTSHGHETKTPHKANPAATPHQERG